MSRKLLPLALGLALVVAACAQPPNPTVDVGSGVRFLPEVADSLNDAGRYSSVVVTETGLPVVAYFGFQEEVPEGEIPAARPVGSPSIPGVFLATVSEQGYWTRGAMAIAEQIPNVSIPFNPAFVPSVADLTPQNVTGLQMVSDGASFHAVWGSAKGLYYATGSLDPTTTTQVQATRVTRTPGIGPSIAVDGGGSPWIAYYTSTSSVASVQVATPDGGRWVTESIRFAGGCDACRTAVVPGAGGPAVAYSDAGDGVGIATNDGENGWVSFPVGQSGGRGLAGATTEQGVALTYYDEAEVVLATGPPTGPFEAAAAGQVAEGSEADEGATTAVAVGAGGSLAAAWHDAETGVVMVTGTAGALDQVPTGASTEGGTFPSVATSADGAASYVSWYDLEGEDLLLGGYGDLGEVPFAAPSPTPTGPIAAPSPPTQECTPVEDGNVTVVAEGIAFTDGSCIAPVAGEAFTITFENRDAGVQHNVEIFSGPDPTGDLLFQGDIVTGVVTVEYDVPALDAGEYAYNCIVHPTSMIGTVQVAEGGGATGGAGATGGTGAAGATGATGAAAAAGPAVTASGLAFDTASIELAAGVPNDIRFVNEDAGVQHNIAIYEDPTLAAELFNGELITGPSEIDYRVPALDAGSYYFLCLVHPTMNGELVVS
jgi:plastocyanin